MSGQLSSSTIKKLSYNPDPPGVPYTFSDKFKSPHLSPTLSFMLSFPLFQYAMFHPLTEDQILSHVRPDITLHQKTTLPRHLKQSLPFTSEWKYNPSCDRGCAIHQSNTKKAHLFPFSFSSF